MFTQKFIYFAMVELFTNHTKESHWAIYDIVLSVRLTCNRFFIFLLLWVPIRGWYHFYILLLQTVTDVEENSTSSNRRSENDASGGTTTKRRCQLVPQTERFGFIYFFAWYIFFFLDPYSRVQDPCCFLVCLKNQGDCYRTLEKQLSRIQFYCGFIHNYESWYHAAAPYLTSIVFGRKEQLAGCLRYNLV